jgi:hypothetical protein
MSHDWPDRWLLAAAADPRTGLWGLVRGGPEPHAALAKLGSPAAEWNPEPELELAVTNDGFATPLATTPDATDALWLLRIAGPHEAPAIAVARPELSKLDSIRVLAACFPNGRAIALAAVRPKSGRADKEAVSVLVAGADPFPAETGATADAQPEPKPPRIFDPRLSTTYNAQGAPLRAGIELWLAADEDGDQRPLRLSAESTGDRLTGDLGNLRLEAYAQRCHSRGEDGLGVYALVRPR